MTDAQTTQHGVTGLDKASLICETKTWHGCQANWNNIADKEWWIINDTNGEELARFPSSLNEHQVMEIVHAVRDQETVMFNAGKEFGGQAMLAANRQKLTEQRATIDGLKISNTQLAEKLESLIGAKD